MSDLYDNWERKSFFAVAPKGTGEWTWATFFVHIDHMTCSVPSAREGMLDIDNFNYKRLTKAEYESYLEMNVLEYNDSDRFAVPGSVQSTWDEMVARQEAFELRELDDVFNQPE